VLEVVAQLLFGRLLEVAARQAFHLAVYGKVEDYALRQLVVSRANLLYAGRSNGLYKGVMMTLWALWGREIYEEIGGMTQEREQ
jgi:hypothetical protein